MLYNALISALRTAVAALVGLAITWLVARGVVFEEGFAATLEVGIFTAVTFGYNALVNWLATKVHPGFGWLLGVPKTPEYNAVAAQRPSDGQIVATVNSSLPTGDIVTVQEIPEYQPEHLADDPYPGDSEA